MISIVVCDDQNTFLEHLVEGIETTLDGLNEKAKVYSFTQVAHIPNSILSGCDIALLDIDFESEHHNGIDLARKIRAVRKDAVIIFVTNYIEYAPEGYEVNAFRYLLKSELTRKLPLYLAEALSQVKANGETLNVQIHGEQIRVPQSEILYIESQKHTVIVHTMAVANVAIIYLINIMEKRTREEQELMLLNQQMEIQTGSILALEKSYRSQRAVTHEFRNQLQTISDLISDGAYREVQDYLHQLQDAQVSKVLAVNTHHPIMDAILNQKHQAAVECGIDIQMQVNDLSGLRIPTNSLVVLFSNLLDNAMEACQRLPENRVIRCSILASDVLYISIRNTSLPVTIVDGMIQTSKAFREEHGFGLVSIRRILDEFQGEYAFQYDDGWFQFAAEIPL